MKKLLLSSLLATSLLAYAYTTLDSSNAIYLAERGIITQQSTTAGYRLDDTITRAEVAGIAMKIRLQNNVAEVYNCKKFASTLSHKVCK